MQWAEMIVLIVLIVTIGKIVQSRFERAEHRRTAQAGDDADAAPIGNGNDNLRLKNEVRDLKERIAVLERLATDDNSNSARLDREIERLRDGS